MERVSVFDKIFIRPLRSPRDFAELVNRIEQNRAARVKNEIASEHIGSLVMDAGRAMKLPSVRFASKLSGVSKMLASWKAFLKQITKGSG